MMLAAEGFETYVCYELMWLPILFAFHVYESMIHPLCDVQSAYTLVYYSVDGPSSTREGACLLRR